MRSLMAGLVAFQVVTQGIPGPDPFAFFRPTVHLPQTDRESQIGALREKRRVPEPWRKGAR